MPMYIICNRNLKKLTLLYPSTPKIAKNIPRTLVKVTGFPIINREAVITEILLEALATA